MMLLLTLLTAVLVLVFFIILAVALVRISRVLESIGGTPTSFLAKLRFGLRAIEKETSHLNPRCCKLMPACCKLPEDWARSTVIWSVQSKP